MAKISKLPVIILLSHRNYRNHERIVFCEWLWFCANCKDNSKNTPSKTRVFGSGMPLGRKYRKIECFAQMADNERVNAKHREKSHALRCNMRHIAHQYMANWAAIYGILRCRMTQTRGSQTIFGTLRHHLWPDNTTFRSAETQSADVFVLQNGEKSRMYFVKIIQSRNTWSRSLTYIKNWRRNSRLFPWCIPDVLAACGEQFLR